MSNKARGTKRERDVVKLLREDGWDAHRMPASLGAADVIANKKGELLPRYIQVKSDRRSPYAHFGPAERRALIEQAERAGGVPVLAWWPPDRKGVRFIYADAWPEDRR